MAQPTRVRSSTSQLGRSRRACKPRNEPSKSKVSNGLQALAVLSAHDLAAHVRARKASPVDVVDDVLRRIHLDAPQLNAFVVLDRDGAMSAARKVEAALM